MTEVVSDEKIVVSTETATSNERIAERKTVVYETRIEPTVIETIGDKLKAQLFTRFGFMKPKSGEIQLVSIDKYYEPYVKISGSYAIDYYRKCSYLVKVEDKVQEVILADQKYKPNRSRDSQAKDYSVIRLQGEERLIIEVKASLVMDKFGQEVSPAELPFAPSEKEPEKILVALGVKEIAPDADLDVIRSKILTRPRDINRLVTELFEVDERAIIYTPRFRVLYTNVTTGETKAMEFDGVTAQRIQRPRPLPSSLRKSL